MAFSAYKQQTDVEELGLSVSIENFIPRDTLTFLEASDWLKFSLTNSAPYAKISEKSKSEFLVAPVLLEIILRNKDHFSILSGVNFEVKRGENGKSLKGAVDFLLCKGKELLSLKSPLIAIVEAKKDDLVLGYWQCAAEMVAAQQFNLEKGKPTNRVWGCVSTGFNWQFLLLMENQLTLEKNIYTLNDLPQLLGAWQWILDECK